MKDSKIPPQAINYEEIVLASCLIDENSTSILVENFKSKLNVFYKRKHQLIYEAILNLFEKSEPIDLLTVSQKLKEKKNLEKIGGDYYLVQLTQKISSSAHLDHHCKILIQYFIKRKAIEVGSKLTEKSYKDEVDIFDLLDDIYFNIDNIHDWLSIKTSKKFKDNVDELFKKINSKHDGIPSGITSLQKKLNGYQKGNLIILAGRPGMGKTAFITSEALSMTKKNISVGLFSLEMTDRELTARLLSNYSEINTTAISNNQTNDFENRRMLEMKESFGKLPINIHDQGAMTPIEIKIQSKKWVRENDVKIIFIDYIQLMNPGKKCNNREQEISTISQSLKALAKELDIPIIALSQLSRAVETRQIKRPILSDLRNSGSIEQDADLVMFLYRPQYYDIKEWDDDNSPTQNQAEVNIAKYRNGRTGYTKVATRLEYMRFSDLEENTPPY